MILGEVWDELALRLGAIESVRPYARPLADVTAPAAGVAAVVGYPEEIEFDRTYGRGTDEMVMPVMLLVPDPETPRCAEKASRYTAGAGADSVKAALETGPAAGVFEVLHVGRVTFERVVTAAGTPYLGITFNCTITGAGTA